MMIIKIGGGADINTAGIIEDLAEHDEQCIIVHGANHYRDQLANNLNKPIKVLTSISGYSSVYSDKDAIDLIMMAYAGLRNKRIVELCQRNGINAIGLSGIDGGLIRARRNRGIRIRKGQKRKIVRDFSGKPKELNTDLLLSLLDQEYTPVLCIPLLDEKGFAVNSENDDIVNLIQESVHADTIIQFIEAPGFMVDIKDPDSLVKKMTTEELAAREQPVEGRMKRKMLALRSLFNGGKCRVILADGRVERPLKDALDNKGTVIQ